MEKKNSRKVEITDTTLIKVINEFIKENKVNSDSNYITVNYESIGLREVIYVSHENTFYRDLESPIFISNLSGFLVFIYNPISYYVQDDITSQILDEIRETKIKSEPDLRFLSHPPIWKITKCGENFELEKTASGSEKDVIPCGFIYDENEKVIKSFDDLHTNRKN